MRCQPTPSAPPRQAPQVDDRPLTGEDPLVPPVVRHRMHFFRVSTLLAGCLAVSACSLSVVDRGAPEGGAPTAPEAFRQGANSGTGPELDGNWWEPFGDPALSSLVASVAEQNPDARAAMARVEQAYATMGITRSERFPSADGDASATHQRDSLNNLLFPLDEPQYEQYRLAASASWEIDLWGRLRGAFRRDRARVEAAQEDYRAAILSLQTTMARQYFAWRFVLREIAILRQAVDVRSEALQLQESRAERGAGIQLDVARAQTELETTRADAEGLERTRGKLEHALAVLAGKAPSSFQITAAGDPVKLPRVPAGLPSSLLERRPDLRAARHRLEAASLEVGIRKTDWLPRLRLTGSGGVASLQATDLFASKDSLFFSLGPQLDMPLLRAGALGSRVGRAQAEWEEAAESYRSALLTAVREVDDALLDLAILRRQIAAQDRAVDAAEQTARLSRLRYDRGLVNYFEVVEADRTRLNARRAANALRAEQAAATVQLIQALGGRW